MQARVPDTKNKNKGEKNHTLHCPHEAYSQVEWLQKQT